MKSKLLIVFLTVAFLAVGAQAQDTGVRDSLKMEITVDTIGNTATAELYWWSDQTITGASVGFIFNQDIQWTNDPAKDHFTLTAATESPLVANGFNSSFTWEDSDLDKSNTNNRFLFGGFNIFEPGLVGNSTWQLLMTYELSVDTWDGFDADGIIIDTMEYSAGTVYLFQPDPGTGYGPYWLGPVTFGNSALSADEDGDKLPGTFALSQNYPNPFNPTTEIAFDVPTKSHVTLSIYNILGQKVETLVNEEKSPGEYTVQWDASQQATGVYFYKIEAGDFTETRKMMLLK